MNCGCIMARLLTCRQQPGWWHLHSCQNKVASRIQLATNVAKENKHAVLDLNYNYCPGDTYGGSKHVWCFRQYTARPVLHDAAAN
jgi:hypothetical protein